jgi:hypothetical protein
LEKISAKQAAACTPRGPEAEHTKAVVSVGGKSLGRCAAAAGPRPQPGGLTWSENEGGSSAGRLRLLSARILPFSTAHACAASSPSPRPLPCAAMPTCHRKRVALVEPSPALLGAAGSTKASREVYYLSQTGEIFETYECVVSSLFSRTSSSSSLDADFNRAYSARMSYYRVKQFQCEVTGKSNLTYFEALESEMQEARTMHSRFPEPLKAPILSAVQWRASRFWASNDVMRLTGRVQR